MSKPKVFVVQPVMDVGREALEEFADVDIHESEYMIKKDELLARSRDCDYIWMLGDTPIDEEVIAANENLKGIATMALFPNVVDVEAATQRGIPVTVVPHVITKTTCDLTCALVIGLAWRIVEADAFVRAGRFHQEQSTTFLTHELAEKTVGMIGIGDIGSEIVKRLRAFEMDIIYTKRNRLDPQQEEELGVSWEEDRDQLLRAVRLRRADDDVQQDDPQAHRRARVQADEAIGILHQRCPGRIVDEPALVVALRDGEIAGAGIDVYWNEPPISEPAPSPELYEFDNVILTPHMGSATHEARTKMALAVVENLKAMVDGERAPGVVNPEVYGEAPAVQPDRLG